MNKTVKRILYAVFALLLVVGSIPLSAPRVDAAASVVPTLYCNDEAWYKDSDLPLVRYYSSYLVPVSIFSMFEGYEVVVDRREGEFMIANRVTGVYMTFNYKDSYAMNDKGEEFYFISHRMYSSEYYVPADTVCEYFGLDCEVYSSTYDGSVCLRISDSAATESLAQLLLHYNPAALGVETAPSDTKIEPYAKGKKVYLTFNGIDPRYTERILNVLRQHGMKGTFFLTEKDIKENPETVIRIYTEGHAIGIYVETVTEGPTLNFDDAMNQLGRANQMLFQLLKIRTRLIRTDLSATDTTRILAGVHYENLKYCGYVLWNHNNSSYIYNYTEESVRLDILQTVTGRQTPVVYVPNTEYCTLAFASAMEELSKNESYTFLAISASMREYNYIETIQ